MLVVAQMWSYSFSRHLPGLNSQPAAVCGGRVALCHHLPVLTLCASVLLLSGICKAVGKALGKEPRVVIYNPEETGTGKAGKAEGFPFR